MMLIDTYILTSIIVLGIQSYVTRMVPFIFANRLRKNQTLRTVALFLPGSLMFLLIIHNIKPTTFTSPPFAIAELLSLSVLVIIHLWKRNMILSIFLTTILYMFLKKFVFH